jgi:hypothetical protein
VEGRRPTVEWTSGRQCSSLGRRGSTGVGEACGVVSWAGGGWAVADVGAQLVEEETAREELTPGVLAVGSGSKEVLVKAGMRAVWILGLDGDGEVRTVAAMVDSVDVVKSKRSRA